MEARSYLIPEDADFFAMNRNSIGATMVSTTFLHYSIHGILFYEGY
jgi:hypothetical protein